ncbi:FAD-binding protein, partial [Salmonella sp. s55962]|uniref:FAD-binding protein n=1 Tax=Salmonella sp. s55962 TaxID=3159685 RepID=UPI0039813C4A
TTALRKGMNLRLNVNVLTLCEAQGAVRGEEIEYQGQRETLHARRGVVLAAGGFAAGALATRDRPHTREHFTMSPPANDGAALHLAAAFNAREGADRASNLFWAPVSVLSRADGSEERF